MKNQAHWKKTFPTPTQRTTAPFQAYCNGWDLLPFREHRADLVERFKMHFHRLHWKVSLFAHRQQDSKACHVYCRAGFTALTMAQRVHLPVSMGTHFLRTGSEWSRIFHLKVENMHLWLLSTSEAWTDWIARVFKLEAKNIIFGDVWIRVFQLALQLLLLQNIRRHDPRDSLTWEECDIKTDVPQRL